MWQWRGRSEFDPVLPYRPAVKENETFDRSNQKSSREESVVSQIKYDTIERVGWLGWVDIEGSDYGSRHLLRQTSHTSERNRGSSFQARILSWDLSEGTFRSVPRGADGFSYQLPHLQPGVKEFQPEGCAWVFQDGKVYVFGGPKQYPHGIMGDEADVMHLPSESRRWKQCASMPSPRAGWSKGFVVDGKIYVVDTLGAFHSQDYVQTYDPANDSWDLIELEPGIKWRNVVPGLGNALGNFRRLLKYFRVQNIALNHFLGDSH